MTNAFLTRRQREILVLLVEGRSTKEISAALLIDTQAIYRTMTAARKRVGAATNEQLVLLAIRAGLLEIFAGRDGPPPPPPPGPIKPPRPPLDRPVASSRPT